MQTQPPATDCRDDAKPKPKPGRGRGRAIDLDEGLTAAAKNSGRPIGLTGAPSPPSTPPPPLTAHLPPSAKGLSALNLISRPHSVLCFIRCLFVRLCVCLRMCAALGVVGLATCGWEAREGGGGAVANPSRFDGGKVTLKMEMLGAPPRQDACCILARRRRRPRALGLIDCHEADIVFTRPLIWCMERVGRGRAVRDAPAGGRRPGSASVGLTVEQRREFAAPKG